MKVFMKTRRDRQPTPEEGNFLRIVRRAVRLFRRKTGDPGAFKTMSIPDNPTGEEKLGVVGFLCSLLGTGKVGSVEEFELYLESMGGELE